MTFDELAKTKPPHIPPRPSSIQYFFMLASMADAMSLRLIRDYYLRQITDIIAERQEPHQ